MISRMLPPRFYMYYVTILVCGVVMGTSQTTSWMMLGGTSAAQPPLSNHDTSRTSYWSSTGRHTDGNTQQFQSRATKRKIKEWCMSLPGLVPKQQKMCITNPALVAAAARGTEMAVRECERQFMHMRWNCSLIFNQRTKSIGRRRASDGTIIQRHQQGRDEVLAPGLRNGTKESAFLHAIMSAGIAYSVTLACRVGDLLECHCDKSVTKLDIDIEILAEKIVADDSSDNPFHKFKHNTSVDKKIYKRSTLSRIDTNTTWVESYAGDEEDNPADEWGRNFLAWGGCSDDVRYGVRYSRRFVEAPYKGLPRRKLTKEDAVDLHNSEVGRRVVQSLRRMRCNCHGTSGSCNVQTCWMQMATFQEVGDKLRKKYLSSIQSEVRGRRRRKLKYVTDVLDSGRLRSVPKTELAFVNVTPSLCTRNNNLGILGTARRKCLKHSGDSGDCRYLCCGRGYNINEVKKLKKCDCQFVWCCAVRCKECEVVTQEYTCKD